MKNIYRRLHTVYKMSFCLKSQFDPNEPGNETLGTEKEGLPLASHCQVLLMVKRFATYMKPCCKHAGSWSGGRKKVQSVNK